MLDRIAGWGYRAIHLAASYHTVQAVLPHNPRRRTYLADRAALYFAPRAELWAASPLKPLISDLATEQGDALAAARPVARDLGLRLVAWTVCLHNSDMGFRYPSVNVRNLHGEAYRNSLCAAHPDVRAYLRTLVRDLSDRVDAIELEAPHWLAFPHHQHAKIGVPYGGAARLALSLCFCEHCCVRALAAGADVDRLQAQLREWLPGWLAEVFGGSEEAQVAASVNQIPDLERYLLARQDTVTSLVRELVSAAGSTPVYAMPLAPRWLGGADRAALAQLTRRLEAPIYAPAPVVRAAVEAALAEVGDRDKLFVGLSLMTGDTPDLAAFLDTWQAVRALGIEHIGLYNYGLAAEERLGWVAEALRLENE